MRIISHRGYWRTAQEKNTKQAFERSFRLGFGTETDVRDANGQLMISHDPARGHELTLAQLLELAQPTQPLLAINIKADGLAHLIDDMMSRYHYHNYFVFDMSIPDTRAQLRTNNPVYMRYSEVEQQMPYAEQMSGIWLDAFEGDDWRINALPELMAHGKPICIVSPELHGRAYQPFWTALKKENAHRNQQLILCTDLPETAQTFFEDNA